MKSYVVLILSALLTSICILSNWNGNYQISGTSVLNTSVVIQKNLPLTVHINESVPLILRPAIYRAAKTWNDAAKKELLKIEPETVYSNKSDKDSDTVIYYYPDWIKDRSDNEQAYTSVKWKGTKGIIDADISINARDYKWVGFEFSFEALILHELGHVLGLGHSDNKKSVMYPNLQFGTERNDLIDEDITAILELYGK